ncbi:clumping factor A-like [Drosophila sulfurigaster albostrigata]|uniref:clumping factor A-like n=1 Tax=Drosophila sulfurigaster albostrigata TaxID=89887 RepID=UPI002D21CE4F|nr:clumping factor A-like [Drosophila sulfurigaster albostrigata]XP_062140222.1 clumping factor A-like [Drosophila sulfurigaster albostrigata]XP_062140223.1 clumping factor A-like [Drosophila sulfurigaster albostrigata]XP_062140224.1 clumping factor A-like [Drosophila sulfurigaster albostrigata]
MNNTFATLSDEELEENGKLYGIVEVDQLRSTWKARKFPIEVPTTLMQSGLLPSIFDWPLLGELMPMEQAMGEAMLQQRINDLELLNSLTTSLQRIEISAEPDIGIDVVVGRPSYNVLVQDNGSILVKELPSLHIHVYAVESRAAAGHECAPSMLPSASASEQSAKTTTTTTTTTKRREEEQQQEEAQNTVENDDEEQQLQQDVNDELDDTKYKEDHLTSSLDPDTDTNTDNDSDKDNDNDTDLLTDDESEEQSGDIKLHRRMSFWMRVGHFLRQNIPRLN